MDEIRRFEKQSQGWRILTNQGACHLFHVGQELASGHIVKAVDFERNALYLVHATWWRKLWYSCKARVSYAIWWTRCMWASDEEWQHGDQEDKG